VLVRGRVQGVNFRWSCARQASRSGVVGWVSNLPDGRVEAVFEGEPAAVDQMLVWCHEGPAAAVVTGVEIIDEVPQGGSSFQVR
jgi:acylphosphatase